MSNLTPTQQAVVEWYTLDYGQKITYPDFFHDHFLDVFTSHYNSGESYEDSVVTAIVNTFIHALGMTPEDFTEAVRSLAVQQFQPTKDH